MHCARLGRPLLALACALLARSALDVDVEPVPVFKEWTLHKTSNYANISTATGLTSRSMLLERQLKCRDPTQFLCPGGYCCYENTKCFPLVPMGCCPNSAVTCGGQYCCLPGASCCPAGGCCNPGEYCCPGLADRCCTVGSTCCAQANGCCGPGATCCPGRCCPEGTTCGGNGTCKSKDSSSTRSTTPSTPTTRSSTATRTTASSTSTCSTIIERAFPALQTLRSRATAPVPLFYPDSPEIQDLLSNMCIGMRKRGAVQSEELTYLGPSKQYKSEKDQNRRDAGCVGADNDCDFQGGAGDSCDEYPFASTHEGGIDQKRCTRAHKRCIPHVQNSKQGRIFNKYLAQLRKLGQPLKPGDKFTVQIDPSFDCSKVPDNFRLSKRQDKAPYSGSGTTSTVWQPLGNTSDMKYLIVPLGDVADGQYSVDLNLISGSVSSVAIIDNEGEEYATSNQLTSGNADELQFFLESTNSLGGVGLSAILETESDDTAVKYDIVGKPILRSGGDAPPQNAAARRQPLWSLCFALAAVCSSAALISF